MKNVNLVMLLRIKRKIQNFNINKIRKRKSKQLLSKQLSTYVGQLKNRLYIYTTLAIQSSTNNDHI